MLEPGEKEVVIGWHFTVHDLMGKQRAAINYLPEVVEY